MAFRLTVMIHIAMYFLNSLETAKSCTRHTEGFSILPLNFSSSGGKRHSPFFPFSLNADKQQLRDKGGLTAGESPWFMISKSPNLQ